MVIPFRLTNAPATFQAFIDNVLQKYLDIFIIIYLDDILIYSQTEEDHEQHINQVLQALQDSNLQVKLKKSVFHIYKIKYLGYIIAESGIKMDPVKISMIKEWPIPRNISEV